MHMNTVQSAYCALTQTGMQRYIHVQPQTSRTGWLKVWTWETHLWRKRGVIEREARQEKENDHTVKLRCKEKEDGHAIWIGAILRHPLAMECISVIPFILSESGPALGTLKCWNTYMSSFTVFFFLVYQKKHALYDCTFNPWMKYKQWIEEKKWHQS